MHECDTLAKNDWSRNAGCRRLKAELQQLRRRGALRAGEAASESGAAAPGGSPATSLVGSGRACARCRAPLGRLVNRGAPCRACRLLVCRACRHYLERSPDWVCSVCHKHMEIQAATGEWMNEYVRRPSRRRDNRVYVPPADVVKRSIRRSWTISNPSSRWSATRGSPELRAYNSLPRHQECCYTSLNHVPRDKSPSYPRDESGACGSPRSRDSQQSQSQKYSLPDDEDTTERSPTRSPPAADLEDRPAAVATTTTSQTAEQSPPAGTFRDRMSNSPALSARVRRQQYFSSRSDDDAEFQSRYLQNHVLKQHRADVGRQKSDDYVAGSAPEDKSSSPGSSPSVQESRLAAVRDLRDVTSSSTSHSSREVSPLTRRHQSFDVVDRPQSRTVSLLQHRHSSVDRGGEAAAPASPHRRYFLVGQDAPHSRHSLLGDYVSSTLEYSGNSDSGGEIVATPPPHGRRYGGARDDTSSLSSHKADGSPVHASSGDDFDVEPISGTVFRKVTVKKRRQETRRVLDNGLSENEILELLKVIDPNMSDAEWSEDEDDADLTVQAVAFAADEAKWTSRIIHHFVDIAIAAVQKECYPH
ncbi:synaptotagmin-like protein 5 [Schistocerca piceifrons]|uniref:synaptotagmin-like protein 5 n=1 Tax=Schistocerca piceifrons TaxID=274613 RepID=UPI001F5F73D1|nr:synaptotagmin-like protein 5 [Schistocerca piceifrons]